MKTIQENEKGSKTMNVIERSAKRKSEHNSERAHIRYKQRGDKIDSQTSKTQIEDSYLPTSQRYVCPIVTTVFCNTYRCYR